MTAVLLTAGVWSEGTVQAEDRSPFDRALTIVSGYPMAPDDFVDWPEDLKEVARRQSLMLLAHEYARRPEIPYIWGGSNVGSRKDCLACRRCVRNDKHDIFEKRLYRCKPCQKCGLDCSNFVNLVYNEAGLEYPFASTFELTRLSPRRLTKLYNLVDVGRDMDQARPGDLLLHDGHVTMLIEYHGDGIGDFVHVTRLGDKRRLGHIQIKKKVHIPTYRGGLKRILRHVKLMRELPSSVISEESDESPGPGFGKDSQAEHG